MSYTRLQSTTFLVTGTWQCPGNVTTVYLCGFGGGGGGGSGDNTSTNSGGAGGGGSLQGFYIISVVPGTVYTITIGAGGAGDVGQGVGSGLIGGNTTFGSLATFQGASGGASGSAGSAGGGCNTNYGNNSWVYTVCYNTTSGFSSSSDLFFQAPAAGGAAPENVAGFPGSLNCVGGYASGTGGALATSSGGGGGGAAGPGGNGTNGTIGVNGAGSSSATNAAANTGAGGGGTGQCTSGTSGTGGNGGSGSLTIAWSA